MSDLILFAVFPYVAVSLAVSVGLYRYFTNRFSVTSGSSQFLGNRGLFWGSVPWHYGIVIVLLAHLLATLFPGLWQMLLAEPVRLYVLEITGMGLGLLAVLGIAVLIARRLTNRRATTVTTPMDWILLAALILQTVLGVYIAISSRWGGLWFLSNAVPWLASLARLDPQWQSIAPLPWWIKLHAFNAFLLVALFPFTRLMHIFTYPITHLWRPYQVVIWNRRTRANATSRAPQAEPGDRGTGTAA